MPTRLPQPADRGPLFSLTAIPLGALAFALLALPPPALGATAYKYTDQDGGAHYTESLDSVPPGARSIEAVANLPATTPSKTGKRQPGAPTEIDYGPDKSKVATLLTILNLYNQTHTYSKSDFFVCADMAIDVWNMAQTQGFKVLIAAGNPKDGTARPEDYNHAWVLAEIAPSAWLALETTAGGVVSGQTNPNYYRGHFFDNPREFKSYIDERRGINQQLLEIEELRHKHILLKDNYRQAAGEGKKLLEEFNQQCADQRLPRLKINQCNEMQQTLLAKLAEGKELEGRVKQLADSHATAVAKIEKSFRLLKQPVQNVHPR